MRSMKMVAAAAVVMVAAPAMAGAAQQDIGTPYVKQAKVVYVKSSAKAPKGYQCKRVRLRSHKLVKRCVLIPVARVPQVGPPSVSPVPGPVGETGAQGPVGPAGGQGGAGVVGPTGAAGSAGSAGATGAVGPVGPAAPTGLANWGTIARNTIANGIAQQQGPGLFLSTGAGTDKIAFGNEVDFVGQALPSSTSLTANITGEDLAAYALNAPNVAIEIDPTGFADPAGPNYSTLNSVLQTTVITPNVDQVLNEDRYYLTGAAGTASGCNQVTYCSMAQVQAAYPAAQILTVAVNKGRDYAFHGYVRALSIGAQTFSFHDGIVTG